MHRVRHRTRALDVIVLQSTQRRGHIQSRELKTRFSFGWKLSKFKVSRNRTKLENRASAAQQSQLDALIYCDRNCVMVVDRAHSLCFMIIWFGLGERCQIETKKKTMPFGIYIRIPRSFVGFRNVHFDGDDDDDVARCKWACARSNCKLQFSHLIFLYAAAAKFISYFGIAVPIDRSLRRQIFNPNCWINIYLKTKYVRFWRRTNGERKRARWGWWECGAHTVWIATLAVTHSSTFRSSSVLLFLLRFNHFVCVFVCVNYDFVQIQSTNLHIHRGHKPYAIRMRWVGICWLRRMLHVN